MKKTYELSEEQLYAFINSFTDDFFWFSDNSGSIYFSENILEVTGYTSGELKSLTDIIYNDDRFLYKNSLNKILDNRETTFESEFRLVTREDEIKWVKEIIKVTYDANGNIKRLVGKVTDISKIKGKEIQLREINDELKNQNIAKDSFLNLLSHDLRSPFTSILGFTEIILKEPSLTGDEKNEYLTFIYSSSEKLLRLINYLLDWSKLRSGKLILERRKINLQSLIYSCVSSLTGVAVRKDIEIKVEADKSINILADERLLNRVITNLVSNAIKYSYRESAVIINAKIFNDNFIELIIKDNGTGISEEDKSKMFRIDNMFSATGTSGEKGTGFGLILSKEIIENHNGELWFYSEENNGSEFHITIPSIENSILIVETDIDKLDLLSVSIEENFKDYKILKAKSALDALNYCERMPSVIIIPDELPLMNGSQVLETFNREIDNDEMKIIVFYDLSKEDVKSNYNKFGEVIFLESKSAVDQVIDSLKGLLK